MYNSKYTDNDLKNIIALCEQDENESKVAKNLANRCRKALAYRDVSIRLTKTDTNFLRLKYDEDMDEDAMFTLNKIMGMWNCELKFSKTNKIHILSGGV